MTCDQRNFTLEQVQNQVEFGEKKKVIILSKIMEHVTHSCRNIEMLNLNFQIVLKCETPEISSFTALELFVLMTP